MLNTKFPNSAGFQENKVAMNLNPEWRHKLGYKHSIEKNSARLRIFPYGIGHTMRDYGRQAE